MASRIEDYALIGDCRTAALVSREGSIDWLCLPRFDSGACFAALLGTGDHGRWQIAPASGPRAAVRRQYRAGTLVLETDFETESGAVTLVDAMPLGDDVPRVLRSVVGVRGEVAMKSELVIRFDYGHTLPWVRAGERGIKAIAGPDALVVRADVPLVGRNLTTVAEFVVRAGQTVSFDAAWQPSFEATAPPLVDVPAALAATTLAWETWSAQCVYEGKYREAVVRSLITLKALTDARTGGIVAAATTSLPEAIGGVRNWDYRFCWVRDATFTLYALMHAGFLAEAKAWREWLLRAVAGSPDELQIMYGVAGERRLPELELPWLPGYEGSAPVRIGNAASQQLQLDVYGELMDAIHQCYRFGIEPDAAAWRAMLAVIDFVERHWHEPDEGIWEVRGPRRHFTHSKVMAWLAIDRAVKTVEIYGMEGPVERWKKLRAAIFDEVCAKGFDAARNTFTQSYGSTALDASLLMLPLVGFLPATDPRVLGTIAAIEKGLLRDGLVQRYDGDESVDGLPEGEGAFLACSFWLADALRLVDRVDDARVIFERLLAIRNDVGLLAEEYDAGARRMLGNFPQAFSHVSMVNTAFNLSHRTKGPAASRCKT